jgi:hypothetical protein
MHIAILTFDGFNELDPSRQLIGAQCSGTLMLARLGLLKAVPACTDLSTKPWVLEAGVKVLNQPSHAAGNLATTAIDCVAPVGEKEQYVKRALANIAPYPPIVP